MSAKQTMNKPIIEIAKCCGTCTGANRKAQPKSEDHVAHYMVAKTERWCEKHGIPTVREAVCPDWELEPKKGGTPAVKRALKQNRRLKAILELKKSLLLDKIVTWNGYRFKIDNDRVVFSYPNSGSGSYYSMSCKENRFDEFLKV